MIIIEIDLPRIVYPYLTIDRLHEPDMDVEELFLLPPLRGKLFRK